MPLGLRRFPINGNAQITLRNDGLPFDVDRLTLSFGKWRTEALKAYGNAIVVQVMYEIFRAIQIVEIMHDKSKKEKTLFDL